MGLLLRLEAWLGRFEFTVAAVGLVIIVVSTAIAVISRNVFSSPVIWTGELSLLAQVWLTFLGASAIYKERGHIGMTGLVDALPSRLGGIVNALTGIALAVLLMIVAGALWELMTDQWNQSLSTLGLPRGLTSLPVVWCMLSVSASAVLSAFAAATAGPSGEGAS